MDKNIKNMAKAKQKAKIHYRKFKQTGNEKELSKADYLYGVADAYAMKIQTPDHSNRSRSLTVNVNSNNSNKTNWFSHNNTRFKFRFSKKKK